MYGDLGLTPCTRVLPPGARFFQAGCKDWAAGGECEKNAGGGYAGCFSGLPPWQRPGRGFDAALAAVFATIPAAAAAAAAGFMLDVCPFSCPEGCPHVLDPPGPKASALVRVALG